jgi:uncharacterized short protein YbdD (DUF466 family)
VRSRLRALWCFIRQLSTDDAYENYLARHRATHPEVPALGRREFFTNEQHRKWSGIQRCC